MKSPRIERKERVRANIRTVRCYLELNLQDFGVATGIGRRAEEFETGRLRPTDEEIEAIAALAEINPRWITDNVLKTKLEVY